MSVKPTDYALSRNHVAGAVTALSPYVTHGVVSETELFAIWRSRLGLTLDHPLLRQLAWRAFFRHVRRHHGDGILSDLHAPVHAPAASYRPALPPDVLAACTGVHVIDASIRQLYATGWLHNHQRLWLASYCVHLRKVHWRAGADWMYGHLLDGDLASNHLSWQWVAGTFSRKPYLFNAANVARFAPHLASPGTVLDADYETLGRLAAADLDCGPSANAASGVVPPALYDRPPQTPPAVDIGALVRGRHVALVHPWQLGRRTEGAVVVGVLQTFHARFPWSARRWQFVLDRMQKLCDAVWIGPPDELSRVLEGCTEASCALPPEPDYAAVFATHAVRMTDEPFTLPEPEQAMPSFSAWMRWLQRTYPDLFSRRDAYERS